MNKDHFISEIKQFNVYYTLIMDQIKKTDLSGEIEETVKEDLRTVEKTKKQFNELYLSLLQNPDQSIVPFINIVFKQVIANDTIPTSLLRIAIKTLVNLFDNITNAELYF